MPDTHKHAIARAFKLRVLGGKVRNKQMAAFLVECAEDIESLILENLKMARDFISAVDVVLADDAKLKTENTALTADKTALTAQVADLATKQATPETLAAQQKVIDASEVISPSTPA